MSIVVYIFMNNPNTSISSTDDSIKEVCNIFSQIATKRILHSKGLSENKTETIVGNMKHYIYEREVEYIFVPFFGLFEWRSLTMIAQEMKDACEHIDWCDIKISVV